MAAFIFQSGDWRSLLVQKGLRQVNVNLHMKLDAFIVEYTHRSLRRRRKRKQNNMDKGEKG